MSEPEVTHDDHCCMEGAWPGWGPHPDCPGVEALNEPRKAQTVSADMEPYDLSITLPVLARMETSIGRGIFPRRRLSSADPESEQPS